MIVKTHTEEDAIREVERRRLQALVAADIAAAWPLHASDFQLITPIGAALTGEQYLGAIAAGQINYLVWEPGDIAVRRHDSAAVLRYRANLKVIFAGHHVPQSEYWHTDVYEWREDRWMVVWSQATAISR